MNDRECRIDRLDPEGTACDNRMPDRARVVRRFRRLFNALNYLGRRGGDSTDWAD